LLLICCYIHSSRSESDPGGRKKHMKTVIRLIKAYYGDALCAWVPSHTTACNREEGIQQF
jgi:hypothetical protein